MNLVKFEQLPNVEIATLLSQPKVRSRLTLAIASTQHLGARVRSKIKQSAINDHTMRIGLLALCLFTAIACERRTVVTLEEGASPVFVMSGSGILGEVIIYGPEHEAIGDLKDLTFAVWHLVADKNSAEPVDKVHAIRYGAVPNGYRQLIPQNGSPLPLLPGKRYRYFFVTANASSALGYFEIVDGKPVSVEGPRRCFERRSENELPIPCPDRKYRGVSSDPKRMCYEILDSGEPVPIPCPQ